MPQRKMEGKNTKVKEMIKIRLLHNTALLLPVIFIASFFLMLFLEGIAAGSIPDFRYEEQSYSYLSEGMVLLFYLTLLSMVVMFPTINLSTRLKSNYRRKWLICYNVSVLLILVFIFINPFHLFTWFMG